MSPSYEQVQPLKEDTVMKKFVIAAFAAALLAAAPAVQAEEKKNCVRGYGKTVAEAFALGMKLAESKDAQLGVEN